VKKARNKLFGSRSLAASLLCAVLPLLFGCPPTNIYSCNSPDHHCYGIITRDDPSVTFTEVVLDTPQMVGGDGFVTNELWLVQKFNPGCHINTSDACWVEVGVTSGAGSTVPTPSTETHYFWADNRPGGGFFGHDLGLVPQADFDHQLRISIGAIDASTFLVILQRVSDGTFAGSGHSTSNTMTPDRVDFGLELYGTQGAATPDVHFTNIQDQSGYLHSDIAPFVDSPVRASWQILPSQSPNGGRFHTVCC
jgi:hypothetical protein